MLSAQTNSLGRRYAAAPITDWFNPSTAHHSLCRSEPIFRLAVQIVKTIPGQWGRLATLRGAVFCCQLHIHSDDPKCPLARNGVDYRDSNGRRRGRGQ